MTNLVFPFKKGKIRYHKEIPLDKALRDFRNHRRISVFVQKGIKCSNPTCSRIGTRFIQTSPVKSKEIQLHWDIYTDDLILMTIDHIIPKSKGGLNCMDNYQIMCSPCNNKKANHL